MLSAAAAARTAPHYPSWGLGTRRGRGPAATGRAHYPSWGLGTQHRARPPRYPIAHYPSWGLGTRQRRPARAGCSRPHYPSWGLGTRHAAGLPGPSTLITPHGDWEHVVGLGEHDAHCLITPHGDWEPGGPARCSPRWCAPHYPSWGLGTGRSSRVRPDTKHSLPLMGIGNFERPAPSRTPCASLPLMGIGNRYAGQHLGDSRELITPHGDWEPRSAAPDRRRRTSHYPSWGLGTVLVADFPEPASRSSLPLMGIGNPRSLDDPRRHHASLPLMGIGNAVKPETRLDGPDSLPLMGIGNPADAMREWVVTDLITPHGDWEPADLAEAAAKQAALITPHGDWEPERTSGPASAHSPHYPSWGLGTPCSWGLCCLRGPLIDDPPLRSGIRFALGPWLRHGFFSGRILGRTIRLSSPYHAIGPLLVASGRPVLLS